VTVNQRITKIYENLQITQYRFAKDTGVSTATLNNLIVNPEGSPSFSTIQKILSSYKNLNARWLLMGEGDMWINENLDIAKTDIVENKAFEAREDITEYKRNEKKLLDTDEVMKKQIELLLVEMKRMNIKMELMEKELERIKKNK
jgi:predicted transcriptional regulator